jgi:hypothetical protein
VDELILFKELKPPVPEVAPIQARARTRVVHGLRANRPQGRRFSLRAGPAAIRPSRRRLALGAAAALTAAAAAVVVPTVLPGGGTSALTTRAWAVEPAGHGTVRVTVREVLNPSGLERALRAEGIPAYVQFVPGVVKRKGNVYMAPACRYNGNEPPFDVSARDSSRVFSVPPEAQSDRISFLIHPAAIPAGTAVLIYVEGTLSAVPDKTGWSTFADGFTLVRIGSYLGRCVL